MKHRKFLICILALCLIISSFSFASLAEGPDEYGWGVASWYCDDNTSDPSQNIHNDANTEHVIAVSFTMPEDSSYLANYVANCVPYLYIEKDGQPYSKTPLKLTQNKNSAAAMVKIKGTGDFECMVCHNDTDGIPIALSENYETLSMLNVSIYSDGMTSRYTNKMSPETAESILNNGTGSKPAVNDSFKDVSSNSWYYNNVMYAAENSLIKGSGSCFYPDENLSYAEAITMACRIHASNLGIDSSVFVTGCNPWYQTYIEYASKNGIPYDFENLNAEISRSDFVHIFYSSLPESKYTAINDVPDGSIPDVSADSKYADEIYTFYRAGIINGSNSSGNFNPESNIKRCEVAAILCRMIGYDRKTL